MTPAVQTIEPEGHGPLAAPETKMEPGPEARAAFEDMMRAFEAFKDTNDGRLDAIERRLPVDVLTEERLGRIDAALDGHKRRLDDLALKAARPMLGRAAQGTEHRSAEHTAAFERYVRGGEAMGLRGLEAKALSVGSSPDGGYLVPPEVETEVMRRLSVASPIRSIAASITISGTVYNRPFSTTGPAAGWVGETDTRPETASPPLAQLSFPAWEIYAMPSATQALLDDSAVDIDAWLAAEIEGVFAEKEGTAFVGGDGVKKPTGFLSVPKVAQGAWAWGSLGYVATGAAGAFAATSPSDTLVDVVYSAKPGYRQEASFVMNRRVQSAIRKFKDQTGAYLWAPPATPDARAMLLGFPLVEAEDMPDISANSFSVAFGNFRRGYLVVDRAGLRVLRDPYTNKPYVMFYTTKRVGGGVQDYDAIKLLKFAAS